LARPPGGSNATAADDLQWHSIAGDLRAALQSNQLFLVIADGNTLKQHTEFEYRLTPASIADLALEPLPVPDAVRQTLTDHLLNQAFDARASFLTALRSWLSSSNYDIYGSKIANYAAFFEVTLEHWRFRLSPWFWRSGVAEGKTIAIFKFAHRSLSDLIADTSAWMWPAAAAPLEDTRARLRGIVDDARARLKLNDPQTSDYAYFVRTVVDDPDWNGFLFLDADVPLTSLPDELKGLAAGIQPEKFRAHHLGVSVTPVRVFGGQPRIEPSAFFGLIAYHDPDDLNFKDVPYDFKVLSLRILFRNSVIAGFASEIELMANQLFGETSTLPPGLHANNILMTGVYQHDDEGGGTYVFGMTGSNRFTLQSAVLNSVEIVRAQFNTTAAPREPTADVKARFLLWGRLRFTGSERFDLFSFGDEHDPKGALAFDGGLGFSGLAVDMAFPGNAPSNKRFTFNASALSPDLAASAARPRSLYNHFPLNIAGFVQSRNASPQDLGFTPVAWPISTAPLGEVWWGLPFTLELGTLGALAAQAGLVVTLLAAWSAGGGTRPAAFLGLKFPEAQGPASLIPIQGVLKLGFKSITFEAAIDETGANYVLKFKRFALSVLSKQFPPGDADISIFGNPDARTAVAGGERTALGWYAAYRGKS
jgi:hypothetical protein